MTAPLAFTDCETISLDPGPDVIWEVGIITRDPGQPDQEWQFQIKPNERRADPESLRICRFEERYAVPRGAQALAWTPPTLALGAMPPARLTYGRVADSIRVLLDGRHVVGAVPNFDTERLSLFLREHIAAADRWRDPWHYHLCDVENLAVGYLAARAQEYPGSAAADFSPEPPWNSDALTKALGLDPVPEEDRHTALGDCRWARSIYDLVMGRPS